MVPTIARKHFEHTSSPRSRPAGGCPRFYARLFPLAAASGVALSLLPIGTHAGDASPLPIPGEEVVSCALHMHGSFSEGLGSMEWQTEKARAYGVDVIWWTDHDWRLERWNHTRRYDFEEAEWDPAASRIFEPDDAYTGETRDWIVRNPSSLPRFIAIVDTFASEGKRSLRLGTEDEMATPIFRDFYLGQIGSRKQSRYSLASRVRVAFRLFPENLDPTDARFIVEAQLSEHPEGRHVLRYVIGSLEGESASTTSLSYGLGTWNEYTLDITGDALRLLSTGSADTLCAEDNSLYEVRIGLGTRNNQAPVVFFDDYRIESEESMGGAEMLHRQGEIASYYEGRFPGVHQLVGNEISRFRPQPHLNAYGTGSLVDYASHDEHEPLTYAVDQVHARGGIVSYNHAFGPWVYADPAESPGDKVTRIREKKRALIQNRALGADLFEVGYRWRGGVNLEDLLDVWDTLAGNAVYLTGNGVSDSHGSDLHDGWGPWQPNILHENNFVTWIYAESVSETGLLRALRGGRAFFGDPNRFAGTLDLATEEGFPMGRVVVTDRESHSVHVRVSGVPPEVQIRLRQVEIRDGAKDYLDVLALRDELLDGTVVEGVFSGRVTLDTRVPSFVRVEVRNPSGEECAFSNPLYFLREVPEKGLLSERATLLRGDLTLFDSEEFDLLDFELNDSARVLRVRGNERLEGRGALALKTGRGRPTSVAGAASWTFEDGVLHLKGFGGASSLIEISWTGEPVDAASKLTLSPGYPNPFGEGITADFFLPRADYVRVAVLDVLGRIVRTVFDEWREAGAHTVTWDGRDEGDRRAANGVYYLRLRSGGKELTSRAVKMR